MIDFWWYLSLGVAGIFTEEAAPLMGGLAAHDHRLQFMAVGVWISAGTYTADILLYMLGRWRGHWVRKRWPRVRVVILRALKIVRRHPWRSSIAVRYAYGLRFTLPIVCGVARVPIPLYAVGVAISAVTWSFLFTLLGWGFGRTTLIVLGHVHRYEQYLFAAIAIGILITFLIMRRRHVEDEVVEVLATGHMKPAPTPPSGEDAIEPL